jgi:uncharacterized protein with HEPN domain
VQPTAGERIAHIDTAIDDIRGALAGQTKASFTENMMLRLAVERLLEIISEASRHIPVDMKAKEPNINWRRLADLGNWLRHAYHRTDPGSCGTWSKTTWSLSRFSLDEFPVRSRLLCPLTKVRRSYGL